MLFKVIDQLRQLRADMIVGNSSARLLPDLLLRVQFGCGHGKFDNLQARMSRQQRTNSLTTMPRRTVPKQEDRHGWEAVQNLLKMGCAGAGRQFLAARDQFTARAQVKRAVEADFGSPRVNPHLWRIANRR